nr:MAG TPA: hypothetical protein [Caudoviricetes sp.]
MLKLCRILWERFRICLIFFRNRTFFYKKACFFPKIVI